ncbi:MAG: 5'-methylthioadenosine/adenosylhomocysteine nucleosidase [Lachnospiraceae bacterium]|nr:5'-methylthioadenosine/adenosylhomocysteine nucleosidase [Lachnospiraceae bacterium]
MKVGIIGAMEAEVARIKENMAITRTVEKAQMKFYEGAIGSTSAVVVQCGVGKVNAGLCVQILVDCFHVTHLINTGVAGSLCNDLNIGDVVVSTEAVYHDVDATVFGYAPGEVPSMGTAAFPADEMLRKAAVDAVHTAAPDISVLEGRIASGDQFVCRAEQKAAIIETFAPLCTEMEGAAIAQAAYLNKIPFVILRAISDKADGSDLVDYPVFEKKAAADCAKITEAMTAALS